MQALAGNRLNVFSGPLSYPGGPQIDENCRGFLFLVEHNF